MANFEVIWSHTEDDVLLVGEFGGRRLLGVVTREAIEDDANPPQSGLSRDQRNLIAESNAELLSRHFHHLADTGRLTQAPSAATPRVTIRTGDLRRAGTLLSTRILDQPGLVWADRATGKF